MAGKKALFSFEDQIVASMEVWRAHMAEERPNQGLELTNPGAAQSVILPLCLLSEFAAQAHVSQVNT